jgi:hypothetical protein
MRNVLFLILFACSHAQPAKAPTQANAKPATVAAEEFDERVRADFFAGLDGDTAALDRAMKLCEAELAKNPKHAEAMVWHGAGLVGRSRDTFRAGDRDKGIALYMRGLGEMDAAVELEPNNVGVRIPRGAVLLTVAPHVPEPEKSKLLERGVGDYEATYALQKDSFAKLSLHAREQLLYGLTDGYAHLGQRDKAVQALDRMKREAAESELLSRAERRVRGEAVDGPVPCEQCHRAR